MPRDALSAVLTFTMKNEFTFENIYIHTIGTNKLLDTIKKNKNNK